MEFSVLNESNLHKTLKQIYAYRTEGETEVKSDGHIFDILTKDNQVIEIQTKNLSKLLPKILDIISKNHKVTLIHPIPLTTTIELRDENEILLSRRKSPKKNSIYNIFRELTGLYPVLLNQNFTLIVTEIKMIELRKKTLEPLQSKNNRRRFRKDWIKTGKKLEEIITEKKFNSKEDYLALLPSNLPQEFCAKDIQNILKKDISLPKNTYTTVHLMLWVFLRMNLINLTETKGKTKYYKINC